MKCKHDGCQLTDLRNGAKGYCRAHYQYLYRNNLLPDVKRRSNRRQDVGSRAAHINVDREKGKANRHLCACGCGKRAQHWAFDEPTGYSLDVSRYRAMTAKCHAAMDAEARRARKALA